MGYTLPSHLMYIQAWAVAYLIPRFFPTTYQLNKSKSSHAFATKINLTFWELRLPKMYVYGRKK